MTGDASIDNAKFFWCLLFTNLLVDIQSYSRKAVVGWLAEANTGVNQKSY
jgi:hypothetical protein